MPTIILTHEPGEESFLGVLHPSAALFEDYMDLSKIVAEHRHYRQELEKAGARVLTVREILLGGTLDQQGNVLYGEKLDALRRLADHFLRFDTRALTGEAAAAQEPYRKKIIESATPEDLVRIVLMQPTVKLSSTDGNTGLKAQYILDPVTNLFYMRDQMISTSKGVVIGRMHSPQREKECDIAEFCLRKAGFPVIHRICGEGAFLEGGDFFQFGDTAFIGCGMRTTQAAIDQLMDRDLLGCDTLAVVRDRRLCQAEMHLDTYFNIIDRDLATLSEERMTSDTSSPLYLAADVYTRGKRGNYRKTAAEVPFTDFLQNDLEAEIIPISKEDQQRMANNFLTVAPRHIMAVDGQSRAMRRALADWGVKVTWIPLENLKKGYGAAHCMTQVLLRKP